MATQDGSEATALQKVLRNSLSPFAAVLATSLPFAGAPLLPFVAGLFNYVPMFFSCNDCSTARVVIV